MDQYTKEYIAEQAEAAKMHLNKYGASIVEVYCEPGEKEMNREIFSEVLGAALIKRVNFLTKRID